MQTVQAIVDFFSGKKSYCVGALMMLVGWFTNNNDLLLQGLAIITIRAGISKVSQ